MAILPPYQARNDGSQATVSGDRTSTRIVACQKRSFAVIEADDLPQAESHGTHPSSCGSGRINKQLQPQTIKAYLSCENAASWQGSKARREAVGGLQRPRTCQAYARSLLTRDVVLEPEPNFMLGGERSVVCQQAVLCRFAVSRAASLQFPNERQQAGQILRGNVSSRSARERAMCSVPSSHYSEC